MKHNILITVLVILGLTVIGLIAYIALKPDRVVAPMATEQKMVTQKMKEKNTVEDDEKKVEQNEAETNQNSATLVSVDDEWNLYTNRKLGFSMKVPKENYYGFDTNGKPELLDEQGKSCLQKDVVVVADEKTNRVYIGSKNVFYSGSKEACAPFNFEVFDEQGGEPDSGLFGGVILTVAPLKNDVVSINDFLKNMGKSFKYCTVSEPIGDEGININMDSMNEIGKGENLCILNWNIFTKYSQEKQRFAIMSLGQEEKFLRKGENGNGTEGAWDVDSKSGKPYLAGMMTESFKFE